MSFVTNIQIHSTYYMQYDFNNFAYVLSFIYSPTYHSRATECLIRIRETDYVVFVLISIDV